MNIDIKYSLLLLLLFVAVLISGCGTLGMKPSATGPVPIDHSQSGLPEERLLDVWIALFEPGPAITEEEISLGITPGIRNAETRFVPVHLKKTMQQTGYWGAVRVGPEQSEGAELLVSGRILQSDGEVLRVEIRAMDSSGRQWLRKEYTSVVESSAYGEISEGRLDAFQNLYNAIANDLARLKRGMPTGRLVEIRRISELRFAKQMVPGAFDTYIAEKNGQFTLRRLPARNDPMMKRVASIRERDYMFVDTLNDHYDAYYRDTWEPYGDWRRFRAEEAENLRQVESDAMTRKVLGIGAVLGAIALSVAGGEEVRANTDSLRQLMVIGGVMVAKSGFDKDKEKQIHIDSMEELGESFDAEVAPMLVEVDGKAHRLTGSVETQYAKWRTLLQRIHQTENTLPDISVPIREKRGNAASSDAAG